MIIQLGRGEGQGLYLDRVSFYGVVLVWEDGERIIGFSFISQFDRGQGVCD